MNEKRSGGPSARELEITSRLEELLEPVVRSEGLMLVELMWRREPNGRVLRLYVDRPDGGVTLDECTMVSRQISALLDVEDLIPEAYSLEVSSPGLTRKLKRKKEFEIFSGRPARLVVRGQDGRTKSIRGRLNGLVGEEVMIQSEGRVTAIPLDRVAKANLEPEA